jgi:transcription initiation factor TFIIB
MALTIIPKYHRNIGITEIKKNTIDCVHEKIISDYNAGEIFCSKCGTVLVERTSDAGSEIHPYSVSEFRDLTRTGMPNYLSIYDKGLNTNIGSKNVDFHGKRLSGISAGAFNRLRTWDARSKINLSPQRTMIKAFSILNSIKDKLTLSELIVEKAAYIFRKAVAKKITKGRGAHSLIAAAIYAACREEGIPHSLTSVSRASNISRKELAKSYRTLLQSIDLQIQPHEPTGYLTKICNDAKISEKTKRFALELLRRAEEKGLLTGRNPLVFCATIVYLACILKNDTIITQDLIANVAGTTTVSIRNTIPFLTKNLKTDFK